MSAFAGLIFYILGARKKAMREFLAGISEGLTATVVALLVLGAFVFGDPLCIKEPCRSRPLQASEPAPKVPVVPMPQMKPTPEVPVVRLSPPQGEYQVTSELIDANDPSIRDIAAMMFSGPTHRTEHYVPAPLVRHTPTMHASEPPRFERAHRPVHAPDQSFRHEQRRTHAVPAPYCPPNMRQHVRRMGPTPRRQVRFQEMYGPSEPKGYHVVSPGRSFQPAHSGVRAHSGIPPWVKVR